MHAGANGTSGSLSCILHNAGEEGRREARRLNWVSLFPADNPSSPAAPKVQTECFSLFLCLLEIILCEFNEPHDVYQGFRSSYTISYLQQLLF